MSPDEANLRAADEAGDAEASRQLGDLLASRGEIDAAEAALRRAAQGGDELAIVKLGFLLEDHRRDLVGAEAAYRRADEGGSVNGSGNLGRLLRDRGDVVGAESAFRRAVERGSVRAVGDLATVLLRRDDLTAEEVSDLVDFVCSAADAFLITGDTEGVGAMIASDGIIAACDPVAVHEGFRRADARGSLFGARNIGWILREKGHFAGATEAFRRAVERGDEESWPVLSDTYTQWGDPAAAEAVAREGDAAGAANASCLLGILREQSGDMQGAIEAYRRADAGGDAVGSFNLGACLSQRGELDEAEAALIRAKERQAENADAALAQVQRLIARRSQPEDETLWGRGVRLELAGDRQAALMAYVEAAESGVPPVEPREILRYAEILEQRDDALAEAAFHRVVDAQETDIRAQAWRGVARYRLERGDISNGLAALEEVVRTRHPDEAPRALRNIGTFLEDHLEDLEGARAAYQAAIDYDHPNASVGARVNLAQLLEKEGDLVGAERLFREAVSSGHLVEAPRGSVLLGFLLQSQGDESGTLLLWESAAASGAEEWSQRGALGAGFIHYERGRYEQAALHFRIASDLPDPHEAAGAYYFLGLCQARLREVDAARSALQKAVELGAPDVRERAMQLLAAGGDLA